MLASGRAQVSFGLVQASGFRLFVIGPDGTWTLAGMVNGHPDTATEFPLVALGEFPNVGDITLGNA
jgi:hypothetical protein